MLQPGAPTKSRVRSRFFSLTLAALVFTFACLVSGAPADFSLITLAWDPPEQAVSNYNLYMGVSPDDLVAKIPLGNQNTVRVFVNHALTYFAVTAVNENGESAPSELLSYGSK